MSNLEKNKFQVQLNKYIYLHQNKAKHLILKHFWILFIESWIIFIGADIKEHEYM